METPLISIIVPVYNVYDYLAECINSLAKQTYPKLEVILIDDGSADGSGVICDEAAKKDPRFKALHQDNLGLSAARNAGLKVATGTYITFVDSDDYVAPDYVQYLFSLISNYGTKMSICALKEKTLKGREIDYGADYEEKAMTTEETLGRMLRDEGFNVSAYAKLYHRSLFDNIEFPVGVVHEDLGVTYKLVRKCPQVVYGPQGKYVYRKRENSISTAEFSEKKLSIITQTDAMCEEIEKYHPYLINTTNLRRMHARFSVLDQMVNAKELTAVQAGTEQEIIDYLRKNRKHITKNPVATLRDKLAIYALLIGKWLFKFGWNFYSKVLHA